VPHHRHDHFLDDPTHVRAVTVGGLDMLSQASCKDWIARGGAISETSGRALLASSSETVLPGSPLGPRFSLGGSAPAPGLTRGPCGA
jgi:hypothetical protein